MFFLLGFLFCFDVILLNLSFLPLDGNILLCYCILDIVLYNLLIFIKFHSQRKLWTGYLVILGLLRLEKEILIFQLYKGRLNNLGRTLTLWLLGNYSLRSYSYDGLSIWLPWWPSRWLVQHTYKWVSHEDSLGDFIWSLASSDMAPQLCIFSLPCLSTREFLPCSYMTINWMVWNQGPN